MCAKKKAKPEGGFSHITQVQKNVSYFSIVNYLIWNTHTHMLHIKPLPSNCNDLKNVLSLQVKNSVNRSLSSRFIIKNINDIITRYYVNTF